MDFQKLREGEMYEEGTYGASAGRSGERTILCFGVDEGRVELRWIWIGG